MGLKEHSIELDLKELRLNGIKVNYFLVCPRKLWLFDRNISMESRSEKVDLGKLLHETAYSRDKNKEVLINELIKIDILDNFHIREVKYSQKMQEADRMQVLYYLYFLKRLGIKRKGIINYPRQRSREEIELTPEKESELEEILKGIKKVLSLEKPPPTIDKPYCKKCAYYEFCYS